MAPDTERSAPTTALSVGTLVRSGVVALTFSLVVNWLITFGAISAAVAPDLAALQYDSVTFLTTVGVVGATVTYGVLSRLLDNPDRVFVLVAAIVLVVSLIPDFTFIPEQPGGSVLAGGVLGVMHVTTAVICVVVLTNARRGSRVLSWASASD